MNDLIPSVTTTGKVEVDGINIYAKDLDVVNLRKQIGMVFQKSNLFPKSIYENITYGPNINGIRCNRLSKLVNITENLLSI